MYDPEAVYQDDDILQAQYEAEGAAAAADRRRGICHHGWALGGGVGYDSDAIEGMRQKGAFPNRPTAIAAQTDIPSGMALCLDCGILVEDPLERRRQRD